MINNLVVWLMGIAVFWFLLKPVIEKLNRSKIDYVKKNLQSDEKLLKEYDTVYIPKLTTNPLYTVRYLGREYKIIIFITNQRIIFRPYSVFMTWHVDLLKNPISLGFDILYKGQEPKKYLSSTDLRGYFNPNNIYPEFSFENIINNNLSAINSDLGKLEVILFDEKIVNEIKNIVNK